MPMQTTLDNLTQRCEKIEFDRLPLTFRDAVIVSRALAIRCPWIDALCIIKNDQKDRLAQSSQMVLWNGVLVKKSIGSML